MNKTLLLILCDFLLLNLLALTRWDKNELPASPTTAQQPVSAREDVVAALRLTLEEEKANRENSPSTSPRLGTNLGLVPPFLTKLVPARPNCPSD